MDRGSLSDERVIEATRRFVCIRLATYENQKEAEFLNEIYASRSGELENTVFAILAPDGKEKLSRAHRSADRVFGRADRMASELNKIANNYSGLSAIEADRALPFAESIDVGMNIAAADQLPMVVMNWANKSEKEQLEKTLRAVAWQEETIGQFVFAETSQPKKLKSITGLKPRSGVCLVEPGTFGLAGKSLHQFGSDVSVDELKQAMIKVIRTMPRDHKDHRSHVREGISLGIEWESEVPETDPQAVRARQRARGQR